MNSIHHTETNGPPSKRSIQLAIEVLELQDKITNTVFDAVQLTECNPSNDLANRYSANGGTLISAPKNPCLYAKYKDWRATDDSSCQFHCNLVNKVGTHSCATGNFQRRVEHDGEGECSCRYRFPRNLVGNRVDGSRDMVGTAPIVRDVPPVKGSIEQVTCLAGKRYTTKVWEHNHTHTNSNFF